MESLRNIRPHLPNKSHTFRIWNVEYYRDGCHATINQPARFKFINNQIYAYIYIYIFIYWNQWSKEEEMDGNYIAEWGFSQLGAITNTKSQVESRLNWEIYINVSIYFIRVCPWKENLIGIGAVSGRAGMKRSDWQSLIIGPCISGNNINNSYESQFDWYLDGTTGTRRAFIGVYI